MGFKGDVYQWLESLKGFSPQISNCEQVDGGVQFTITDEDGTHVIFIPSGRELELICDNDGIIWQRYKNDTEFNEVINLGEITNNELNEALESLKFVQIVDELPDAANAQDNVIYILKEED